MPVGKQHTDLTIAVSAPVASVRCLVGPTSAAPLPQRRRLCLALHQPSRAQLSEPGRYRHAAGRGGAARDAAALCAVGDLGRGAAAGGADLGRVAIRSCGASPARDRSRAGRGLEITLTIDEAPFGGAGGILLASVLDRFFAKYVSINAFTETVLRSPERGEVMRWPMPLRPAAGAVMRRRHAHPSPVAATSRTPTCWRSSRRRRGSTASIRRCGGSRRSIATGRASAQRAAGTGCGAAGAGTVGHVRPGHARRTGSRRQDGQRGAAAGAFLRPVRPRWRAAAASDGICARPAAQPSRPDLSALRRYLPSSRAVAVLSRLGQCEADRQLRSPGTGPLRAVCRGADRARHGQPARPRRHAGPGQAAFRRTSGVPDAACRGAWRHPLGVLPHAGADRMFHRRLARPAGARPNPTGRSAPETGDAGQDGAAGRAGLEPAAQVPHRLRAAVARRLPAAAAGRDQLSPAGPDRAQLCRRHADLGREPDPPARGSAAHPAGPRPGRGWAGPPG